MDEVTQIKDWGLAIKYFLETKLSKNKLLVATGSNALLLKKGSERLPRRDINVKLFLLLSFRDFLLNFSSEDLKTALKENNINYEGLRVEELKSKAMNLLPSLDELNADLYIYLKTGGYLKSITMGKYGDYSEGFEDKLLQGVVCEALARLNRQYLDVSHFPWFYAKKKETDFVVKVGDHLLGGELRSQNKVGKKDFPNFYSFKERILLSKKDFKYEDKLLILPVSLFLALLGE